VFVASSDEEQPLCKLHLKKAMKLRVSQRGDFQQELFSSLESYSPPHAPAPSRQPDKRRNPLGLTERQDQVARLSHLPRKQIAERLGLSENTVKAHLRNIANRVGMRRRREIARLVEEEGDAESR
jgi:DNA-binding NarL/FixJ family response regulator